MRKFTFTIKLLATIYLLLSLSLFIFQRNLLYHPSTKITHPYQEQTFQNGEELIKVITLNPGKANGIILFGGNAQIIALRAPVYLKKFPHHTVYLVNYRGYGGSSGTPEEKLSILMPYIFTIKSTKTIKPFQLSAEASVRGLPATLPLKEILTSWS